MVIRLLKDLAFVKWATRSGVSDATLIAAAVEIEDGLVDARLGGYLIKKRIAAPGRGKSGGYRTIIGHRQGDRLIFIHGFAKSEKGNISKVEKAALQKICDAYMQFDDERVNQIVEKGLLVEIFEDEQDT